MKTVLLNRLLALGSIPALFLGSYLVDGLLRVPPKPTTTVDFPIGRYRAELGRAIDGDTVVLRRVQETSIRLKGIDAPEIANNPHGPADTIRAIAAREHLATLLTGRTVYVAESGQVTFGRPVADLYIQGPNGTLIDVGAEMVKAGHAKASR